MLKNSLIVKTDGAAIESQTIIKKGYRISVLTESLFRIETVDFSDLASQAIWFRNLGEVRYEHHDDSKFVYIKTDKVELKVSKRAKAAHSVTFLENGKAVKTVRCNNKGNLKGTVRTLDGTLGAVSLGDGLISKNGVAVYDDSHHLFLSEDGEFVQRKAGSTDVYIFAYGRDYRAAIVDFYKISGKPPMIPRFAFGNWWSRYRRYTQEEYMKLIKRFIDEDIPLTVATVDMDWHWTDLNADFGTNYKGKKWVTNPCTGGWTGYSWNTKLFPDYRHFLKWLQSKNLKVTLNLHPADGIRWHEDCYGNMARAMGIDPSTKAPIEFKIGDTNFVNNYFDIVHKPYEKEGVDFWWIDWQQGKKSEIKGLDPLWALNHYHYLDNAENGQIPLILSRYAGVGSHRYPLGFSGDTLITWCVLKFQPYFTANAANVGYTYWSHDIGGHCFGYRDDELHLRWIQFGVFSPSMRLHSTAQEILGKEPWFFNSSVYDLTKKWLTFRHKLISYIYTACHRNHTEGIALCEPMYYAYPNEKEAYEVPNQYAFGSELLIAPITEKMSKKTHMGKTEAFLPNGRWTDIFTGRIYEGGKKVVMYRDLDSIPVLAKEGAIIPLSEDGGNKSDNPDNFELLIYRGNSSYTLYEDDGNLNHQLFTKFEIRDEGDVIRFYINAPEGRSSLKKARNYKLSFKDIKKVGAYSVRIDGIETEKFSSDSEDIALSEKTLEINLSLNAEGKAEVTISKYEVLKNPDKDFHIMWAFSRAQGDNFIKGFKFKRAKRGGKFLIHKDIKGVIREVISEDGGKL
jgi:alpha-glucosidase (family GH31 glycosyl hydrolase)